MNHHTTLTIDNAEFNVTKCKFGTQKGINEAGKKIEKTAYSFIEIEVDSTDDITLFNWMVNEKMRKNGSISFYKKKDSMFLLQKVEFLNGLCLSYDENFDQERMQMRTCVTIYASKILFDEDYTVSSN